MDLSITHIELVEKVYATLEDNIAKLRLRKSDSLTLAEKILYGHARNVNEVSMNKGEDFGDFLPDRVAMQDATAQMAYCNLCRLNFQILQFPQQYTVIT